MKMDESPTTIGIGKLKYRIHKCSGASSSYTPENIMYNKPLDQSSRWSADSNQHPQFLVLKLEEPAIVKTITFGKYDKLHVCNLKDFQVYGGLNEEHMILLIESMLKNDNVPETFELKYSIESQPFPCRFIKIVPLKCWSTNFNYSIWYVELRGDEDWSKVQPGINWYNHYRERQAIRLCLKHFRQHNYMEAFESLQKRTKIQLEDPFLTKLHNSIVHKGDFEECESLVGKAVENGLFDHYINEQDYKPRWTSIYPGIKDESEPHPGMRGGHQMCMDSSANIIYLFGGWDGSQDLSDFWIYCVDRSRWECLSKDTELDGGPSARSCHKMCLDPINKKLFTLGRYLDSALRSQGNLKSDFYCYDLEHKKWTLISRDTASEGGPSLVFDHQMCIDIDNSTIYVFGGRVLTSVPNSVGDDRTTDPFFSGLYSYHIPSNSWTKIKEDNPSLASQSRSRSIRSRIGHSMLFHNKSRLLYIFAGQRNKDYLNDFFAYNVDTGELNVISDGCKKDGNGIPAAGFTQRATIDPDLNEIYVLSGLSKDKDRRNENVRNSFWIYSIEKNRWSCIYKNENTGYLYWNKMQHLEPSPRFAHQLVYDENRKVHYLFGGNPGKVSFPKMRLDDFWSLHLEKPSRSDLLHRCVSLIRKHRYKELACTNSLKALEYLQSSLAESVNHNDQEQEREFQRLPRLLFGDDSFDNDTGESDYQFTSRTQLFDTLVTFFPENMVQPKESLIDLITL